VSFSSNTPPTRTRTRARSIDWDSLLLHSDTSLVLLRGRANHYTESGGGKVCGRVGNARTHERRRSKFRQNGCPPAPARLGRAHQKRGNRLLPLSIACETTGCIPAQFKECCYERGISKLHHHTLFADLLRKLFVLAFKSMLLRTTTRYMLCVWFAPLANDSNQSTVLLIAASRAAFE